MTLGTFGSTLNDELNRLANNGVYRDKSAMVDEALAAKQWANREYITPYSTDTVGILNEIAGLGLDKKNWLDFNGVCNYIAGTTGLPAAAALRQVQNTSDLIAGNAAYYIDATDASASSQTITNLGTAASLLPTTVGSSTAADSNDPKFLDFTGTNYVYLPGVTGNYISVPDAANLRITGDLDLRANISPDTYSVANGTIISKYTTTGNQRGFWWRTGSGGGLELAWSADGSAIITAASSTTVPVGTLWVRVTLDVDNGTSGNDVKFYTSTNGTTWTQLGTTVTTAGTTSIFASTAPVEIGSAASGAVTLAGKYYRAQIFNGIDGTKVLDVDTSVITAGSATSFTAVTGQTVTINRSTSGRKTVAVTQPVWLFGTDDYMEVNNRYMASGTYLYLPSINGNYASAPDSAALDITGDIDIRVKVALDDWTPSAEQMLVTKWTTTGNQRTFLFSVKTDGALRFAWTQTGSFDAGLDRSSTVATGLTDGSTKWVRVTLDVDNGSGSNVTTFYTSDDGTTWTQLGNIIVVAGVPTTFVSTAVLEIGSQQVGTVQNARGKFFRTQIRNGIDGTVAFDADFETSITSLNQASFTESSANAATVTINRSGSTYRSAGITTSGYLYPGATNTFTASATDFLNFGASDSFSTVSIFRGWGQTNATQGIYHKQETHTNNAVKGYALLTSTTQLQSDRGDGTTAFRVAANGPTVGAVSVISTVDNTVSATRQLYSGASSLGSLSISGIGSSNTYANLTIGRTTSSLQFADMEFIGAAIFRSALTVSQIRQITNYFRNREVYL